MTVEQSKIIIEALFRRMPSHLLDGSACQQILTELEYATTASELAVGIKEYIPQLFQAYEHDLSETLGGTLSPEVWKASGVLFNPTEIPFDGPDQYLVVADNLVRQQVDKEVTYYGDVKLDIADGVAQVMDTSQPVKVRGTAQVDVYGHTVAQAQDEAVVTYHDYAKGTADDKAVVHLHDYAFVHTRNEYVTLHAHDQAQFLVEKGGREIFMDGSARGFIAKADNPRTPIFVHASGEGLLYVNHIDPQCIAIREEDFGVTIIRGEKIQLKEEELIDALIPRYRHAEHAEVGIQQPYKVNELVEKLSPYLKGLDNTVLFQLRYAHNESELCQTMATFIPAMVEQGLTGEFLRNNFTEASLEAANIHAFSRPETTRYDRTALGAHHFFGNQLVHGDRYIGTVIGYENTLVIGDERKNAIRLEQNATGITVNQGHVYANGKSQVFAYDHSSVQANAQSVALLHNDAIAYAFNQARVLGQGQSYIFANDESVVFMYDQSNAAVSDRVRVLANGHNKIHAHGEAVIGCWEKRLNEDIFVSRDSEKVQVKQLSLGEFANFVNSMEQSNIQDSTKQRRR